MNPLFSVHGSLVMLRKFAGISSTTKIFFILLLQSDNEVSMSPTVFEIKRVENYPNFDKSALVTQYGLSGW